MKMNKQNKNHELTNRFRTSTTTKEEDEREWMKANYIEITDRSNRSKLGSYGVSWAGSESLSRSKQKRNVKD